MYPMNFALRHVPIIVQITGISTVPDRCTVCRYQSNLHGLRDLFSACHFLRFLATIAQCGGSNHHHNTGWLTRAFHFYTVFNVIAFLLDCTVKWRTDWETITVTLILRRYFLFHSIKAFLWGWYVSLYYSVLHESCDFVLLSNSNM